MIITFKELLEEVYQVLPSTGDKGVAPISVYDGINAAIEELSAESGIKELMPERTEYIEISTDDDYALSSLDYQHKRTEFVRNQIGNRCDRKSWEFVKTMASAGEKKYAQQNEKILVKPLVEAFTSEEITFTETTNIIHEDSSPNGFSFVTKGFLVGQKIYVSGTTNNDGIYTLTGDITAYNIETEEDLTTEAKGDTITIGLAHEIVYRHALPVFSSFAGATSITIDEYFIPAIVHLTIANIAQAKGYGTESAISDRYFAIYEKDVEGLKDIMSQKKQKQM